MHSTELQNCINYANHVPTMVFRHGEGGAIGHGKEGEMGQLICPVLQTGHGCRSYSISVLRQRVQHLAVYIATHQIPYQLDLTGMICLRGNIRDRRTDFECNGKMERGKKTKYNEKACSGDMRQKKKQKKNKHTQ